MNVSMKSGLEGRNNDDPSKVRTLTRVMVSMKSGLEGRNNMKLSKGWKTPRPKSQ